MLRLMLSMLNVAQPRFRNERELEVNFSRVDIALEAIIRTVAAD